MQRNFKRHSWFLRYSHQTNNRQGHAWHRRIELKTYLTDPEVPIDMKPAFNSMMCPVLPHLKTGAV